MSDRLHDVPDLGSLDDGALRQLVRALEAEALQVSYTRRILHGKIDLLRAELVARLRRKHEWGEARPRCDADDPPQPDGGVRQPRPRQPRGPGSLGAPAGVEPRSGA